MTDDGRRAPFIVLEGGEGCGKTTQAPLLADRIAARLGVDPIVTREPGGTEIGSRLRAILLDPGTTNLAFRAEALLMAADRAQHTAEMIRPALEAGTPVVCDRYLYSSVAYQGWARHQDPNEIRDISLWAVEQLLPDLVVLVDLDPDVAATRLDRSLDRFEQAGEEFHRRVRDGFLTQASEDEDRWVVVDGAGSIEAVADAIWAAAEPIVDRYR